MIKKNLHPKLFITRIYQNSNLIAQILTTQKKLNIEIWYNNNLSFSDLMKKINFDKNIKNFEKKYNLENFNLIN